MQQEHELRPDRRVVTVVFADLKDSTEISEQNDPEIVRDFMKAWIGAMTVEVSNSGGTFEKQIGDAVYAVFGAPIAHEDDAIRAVGAALRMQKRMRRVAEEWSPRFGRELRWRIGVNTGLVVMGSSIAGGLAHPEKADVVVTGDPVSTGKRIEEATPPGRILVGEATFQATRRAFNYAEPLTVEAKGKHEPVTAYEPLSILQGQGVVSPLVGRERELGTLQGCVERLEQGSGGLAWISGEPGLGKSRLVAELHEFVARRDVRWLEGRAISFGNAISYWPFVEIVRRDAEISDDDDEDESWRKLESRVSDLFPAETDDLLPYLGALSLGLRDEFVDQVLYRDGDALAGQIFRVARRLFERLAAERPLVVVLEDWHWADGSSVDLLEHLLPLVEQLPLLICCVTRTGDDDPTLRLGELSGKRGLPAVTTEVPLSPLSTEDSAELVCNLLELDELPTRLRQPLQTRTEGNPFFIEEVVRTLIDLGAIVRDDAKNRWEEKVSVAEIAWPDGLVGVVMARVDRLDEDQKEVLRLAAVIGRTFHDRVLRAVAGEVGALDRILDDLRRRDLIQESNPTPELEYAFKHAVIRDVVYDSILKSRRVELHRRVADCIEALFEGRLEEVYSLLAYHFAQAEDGERALDYLLKAGEADSDALTYYRQAHDKFLSVFGEASESLRLAQLERRMGEALSRRSDDHEEADLYFKESLSQLGSTYPGNRLAIRFAIVSQIVRQLGHRRVRAYAPREPTESVDPIVEECAANYHSMSWMHYFTDREKMCLEAVLQLNLSERNGYALGMARGYDGLGIICDVIPWPDQARRYHELAVEMAERTGHSGAIGLAHLGLCAHEQCVRGRWLKAVADAETAAAEFHKAGDLRGEGVALRMLNGFLAYLGELERSAEVGSRIVRLARETGHKQVLGWGLQGLGQTYVRMGRLEEARACIDEALPILEEVPDHRARAMAMGDQAQSWLQEGEVETALGILAEARKLIRKHGLRGFSCTPVSLASAEAYLASAEQPGSRIRRARLLWKARVACFKARRQSRLDSSGRPGAYRLTGTCYWLRGRRKKALELWEKSLESAADLGAKYDAAITEHERGCRTGTPAEIETARVQMHEIRAEFGPVRAQMMNGAGARERVGAAL